MKVTSVEIVKSNPVKLPCPFRGAWMEPSENPILDFSVEFYRLTTDEGIVGIGPYTGASPELVIGFDPFFVGEFFNRYMSGKHFGEYGRNASGLEIALWDIIGKASNQPIHRLLGAVKKKILVYAATSRLLSKEELVQQSLEIKEIGFKGLKLRLHRENHWDDLAVVEAVRNAIGNEMMILVDANQNHRAIGYNSWTRPTALKMAKELDALNVYFLEEPLPRKDIEGLARIAQSVNMFIAGGEHSPTMQDFKQQITLGAYDIVQPDIILGGNMGLSGVKKIAEIAEYFDRLIIPHVCSNANFPVNMAATLQVMATVDNCPMIEYPYDPPILTTETTQPMVKQKLLVDKDGYLAIPEGPGLGVEFDEEMIKHYCVITAA